MTDHTVIYIEPSDPPRTAKGAVTFKREPPFTCLHEDATVSESTNGIRTVRCNSCPYECQAVTVMA